MVTSPPAVVAQPPIAAPIINTEAEEVSDEEIWSEMEKAVYDGGWQYLEKATERAWGEALDQDQAESVLKILDAGADGDWRNAGIELSEALLDKLPNAMGLYIELFQYTRETMQEGIDEWAKELYQHNAYYRLEELVKAEFRATRRETPSDVRLSDEPFLPSFLAGRVSGGDGEAQERESRRMRAVEQRLFETWARGTSEAESDLDELLFTGPMAARIRQEMGMQPTERQLFTRFYWRIVNPERATYIENYKFVRARQARMRAIEARNAAIDAWRQVRGQRRQVCPPSSLVAGHVGAGGDQTQVIASMREMTSAVRAALATQGISASDVPLLSAAQLGVNGFLEDRVEVNAKLPAFSGGRFDGEIVLVLPPATTSAHFRGRPKSFGGALRTAEVPVGRAIATVSQGYFNARFVQAWLSQSSAPVAKRPLTIELIGPEYSYSYAIGLRGKIVSNLKMGVSACLNGERVIDRVFESGDVGANFTSQAFWAESTHTGPLALTLNNAILKILEEAVQELAQRPGFADALRPDDGEISGPVRSLTPVAEIAPAVASDSQAGARPDASPPTPMDTFKRLEQLNTWLDEGRLKREQYDDLRNQILAGAR